MNGTLRVATIYGEPQMRPGNTCYDHGVSPVDCGLQEKCPSASLVTSAAAFAASVRSRFWRNTRFVGRSGGPGESSIQRINLMTDTERKTVVEVIVKPIGCAGL